MLEIHISVPELDMSMMEWLYIMVSETASLSYICDSPSLLGNSFSPTIMWSRGALRQDPSATKVAPAAANSSSSYMRAELRSTLIL